MIRFSCESCNQKIRVADNAPGKKGCCPNCKQTISVPGPELLTLVTPVEPLVSESLPPQSMIHYECQMCRNALSASKEQQGEIKECPHCGCFVEVPIPQQKNVFDVDTGVQLQPKPDVQDDYEDPFDRRLNISEAKPERPKRLLPIFLDVFLFPVSKSGLMMLFAFTLAPIILYPLAFLGLFGPFLYLIAMICAWSYMFWYFSLCIHKSAEGDVRAPDTFNEDVGTSLTDMVLQMLRTIMLIVVCLLPPLIYRIAAGSVGPVFYGILAVCTFFLPMMLLASVMFDSFWTAWNPRVILGGMFSSFIQYIVLVLVFYIPIVLYFYVWQLKHSQENLALALALNACSIYLIMVSSHLLGWFFYKNEEKLYWAV